jgi:hypothetical protein
LIRLGTVDDFYKEDLRQSSHKLLVREGIVYLSPNESTVHFTAVRNFCEQEVHCQVRGYRLKFWPERRLKNVPDHFGCTVIRDRTPDACLEVQGLDCLPIQSVLISEVTFRNGGFQKAVTIAATYLMPWTNHPFVLVVLLEEAEGRDDVESIRFILMERISRIKNLTGCPLPGEEACRDVPEQLKLRRYDPELTNRSLGQHLQVRVLQNFVVRREDLDRQELDLTIKISVERLVFLTGLDPGILDGPEIVIDLRSFCRQTFATVNSLVARDTYPYLEF